MHFPDFGDPSVWLSLLTLTFLEIILGVDNIIFISIVANRLPESKQQKARYLGLLLAMGFRILLLLTITWIIRLTEPVLTFGFIKTDDGNEIFVHVTGLIDKVRENDSVTFEVAQGKKGLNAVDVKLA